MIGKGSRLLEDLYASAFQNRVLKIALRLYLRIFGVPLLGKQIRHKNALPLLPPELNGKMILDAGCTIGDFSLIMSLKGATVLGIDINNRMQDASKLASLNGLNASFSAQNLFELELQDYFNGVVALDLFEHIEDDLALATKFHTLLKPGGFLVVSVPSLFRRTSDSFERSVGHVRKGYSIESLSDVLTGSSFHVEQAFYVDPMDLIYFFYGVNNNILRAIMFPFLHSSAGKKAGIGKTGSILMCKAFAIKDNQSS